MRSTSIPADPSTAHRALHMAAFRRQGVLAGVFGASILAAWFLYLDTLRNEPLHTPVLLATSLLSGEGAEPPKALIARVWLTVLFTVVHGLVFVAVGVLVAYLLEHFALFRTRALLILLIFGILCLGFFVVGASIATIGPEGIAVRDALIGNAVAAVAMGAYLARFLPSGEGY